MFTKSVVLFSKKSVILGPVIDCSIQKLRVHADDTIRSKFWSIKKEFLSLPPSSSPITEQQLMKLCQLAKLDYEQISEKNPSLKQDIQSIMQLLDKIQTITIPEQTEPMYSILQYYYNTENMEENFSTLRQDEVEQQNTSKEVLQNAAEKKGQFFSVPKMKGQKDVL